MSDEPKTYEPSWFPQLHRRETERVRAAQTADLETERVRSDRFGQLNEGTGGLTEAQRQDPPHPQTPRPSIPEGEVIAGTGPLAGESLVDEQELSDAPREYPAGWFPSRQPRSSDDVHDGLTGRVD